MTDKTSDIIQAWNAFVSPTERVSLSSADGRIAASTIRQYPPGIPEIIPGMRYSPKIINTLKNAHTSGSNIIGVDMDSGQEVDVLDCGKASQKKLDIQTYDAQSFDKAVTNEIADYFRQSFCAGPYFHFAFHESDPLQSLPHSLDFDAYTVSLGLSDPEKRKACQDTLRETAYQRARKVEPSQKLDSIILPNGFHLWTDKDKCRSLIHDRLSDPGYVTLVRDHKTKKLLGLLHSRMGTVERLFYSEEWSDPLVFSQYQDDSLRDDPTRFFQKMEYHFGLKPTDQIMTISAQVLSPEIQGGEVFYEMMRSMSLQARPEHTTIPLLCEIPSHGTAHTLNTAFTDRIIFGVLKNGHPLVFCRQVSQALFPFINKKEHWSFLLRKAVRKKWEYRAQYFEAKPTDNSNVIVKPNGKLGLAAYATADILTGTRIAVFTGETYQAETALGLPAIMRDHAIQVGPQQFVFGYKGLAHRLCHSCDPNCSIRNLTEIYAVREIKSGEQLTWDYRCSENSNWVLQNCLCNSDRCTGSVANFDSLPLKMKSEYLSKSMVSEWIVSRLEN
ncbi:MAG: SET domain-containing protein-lysine N-methyltransferase [Litorimonas sp.]